VNLVSSANAGVKQIWDNHVHQFPGLRYGSFASALEELAEAELFVAWLQRRTSAESGQMLLLHRYELASGLLKAQDYLGALSDFTGEVGRVAVEAATNRDGAALHHCLRSTYASHRVLADVALPGKHDKKLEAAERNFWKLETIQYDLAVRSNTKGGSLLSRQQPGADTEIIGSSDPQGRL